MAPGIHQARAAFTFFIVSKTRIRVHARRALEREVDPKAHRSIGQLLAPMKMKPFVLDELIPAAISCVPETTASNPSDAPAPS